MIERLLTFESGSFDPFENLAIEQHLLETVGGGCCLFYLWQNQNTVVIGKNQNPYSECRVSLLEAEGGHLARRLSGGGAVFHDLGNLNFTFLVPTADYDLAKQQRVLLTACQSFGIPAEFSGRNDLLADGRKFSGNAFYQGSGRDEAPESGGLPSRRRCNRGPAPGISQAQNGGAYALCGSMRFFVSPRRTRIQYTQYSIAGGFS